MEVNKQTIAGIDEVGRGALFGPVFAGAVVLNEAGEEKLLEAGLKDSKKLSAKKRAILVPLIEKISLAWGLGQASSREIDSIGIRTATERSMLRALHRLNIPIEMVLVDGSLPLRLWDGPQRNLIHGEDLSPAIAAASIIAKEARDSLIKRLAKCYPAYGLERHVGYGTKMHRKAIAIEGATIMHRQTFLSNI